MPDHRDDRDDRIEVHSERATYPVIVGTGAVSRLAGLLAAHGLDRQIAVVSCGPVWRRQGARLRGLGGRSGRPILIGDGERAKSLRTVTRLYDAFLGRGLDRSATIVAFGGGVVGDVAGFAAASYLRGVALVQVPTTLLAQVDSAIGGKVGVNRPAGKNLVGAFHPPSLVVCDPLLLSTLDTREYRAGLYEVVKYGVIASARLFGRVDSHLDAIVARDVDLLQPLIADCCRIKTDVVSRDEREQGPRRALNFGHTIGHALEAITRYRRFRHGEAIGHGMIAAAHLSAARGALSVNDRDRIRGLVDRLGPRPPVRDLRIADALRVIGRDKKVVAGRLHFVLATSIGTTAVVNDVTTKELSAAMRSIGMR